MLLHYVVEYFVVKALQTACGVVSGLTVLHLVEDCQVPAGQPAPGKARSNEEKIMAL